MPAVSERTGNSAAVSAGHGERLLDFLAERKASLSPMAILMHAFPDPDALASAFGLNHLLRTAFGVESTIAYDGVVGRLENRTMVRTLRIPLVRSRPALLREFSRFALLDTQPGFSNNSFPSQKRATLVLDQHPADNPPNADFFIVDPGCGATCVLVAQALLQSGVDIPARVATAIAYGIQTDTLDLYRARRPDVASTYLQILQHCDMRALARIQNPVRPRRFFSILGRGIRDAAQYRRVIIAHLGQLDVPDRVSQVAEFLLTYRRARWCFTSGRYKGRLHVSLRTVRTDAQAGEVLRAIFDRRKDAGGHGAIAGGSCRVGLQAPEATWSECERRLTERLLRRLRIPARVEPRKPFAA